MAVEIRQREVAVLHDGNEPGRTERAPVGGRVAGNDRDHHFESVVDLLEDRGDDRLSCVDGKRNAVNRKHVHSC